MQKLRLRYAKRSRLRFTSHRDVARAFERALRRAGVPMAYSQGFSPHPKVSWVGAAPTGVASEAEYVELQLVERVDPQILGRELDEALPPGLDVLEVVEAAPGALTERIEASWWRIELPGVDPELLREAVAKLLAADHVEVERLTKDGRRRFDARAAVISAEAAFGTAEVMSDTPEVIGEVTDAGTDLSGQDGSDVIADTTAHPDDWPEWGRPCGILDTVVRQTTPVVRPDDVLSALRVVADLVPPVPAKAIRMAQGRLDDSGRLADPFAIDRAVARGMHGASGAGEQGWAGTSSAKPAAWRLRADPESDGTR